MLCHILPHTDGSLYRSCIDQVIFSPLSDVQCDDTNLSVSESPSDVSDLNEEFVLPGPVRGPKEQETS